MFRPANSIHPVGVIRSALLLIALLSVAWPTYAQGSGPDHPQAGKGISPEHGSLSEFPWERIDAYTGNVVLSFQDLVMPGNAGFSVAVSRTYNTKDGGWAWGVGPTMIMPNGGSGGEFPRIRMADGSEVRLHRIDDGVYLSPSFDRYTADVEGDDKDRTLEMASGIVAHFDEQGRLLTMVDPFGNKVEVEPDPLHRLKKVTQYLGNGQQRVAELQYDGDGIVPLSLNCQGRTWQYTWATQAGAVRLTQVTPPEGPAWTFGYGLEAHENPTRLEHTLTVTMPTGGQVQYLSWEGRWQIANELHALDWPTGIPKLYQRRVSAATNLGSPDDLWTFDYIDNGRTTYVTGTTLVGSQHYTATFVHYPGGNPAGAYDPDQPYPAVLLVGSSGTGRDLTMVTWQEGAYLGTPEQHGEYPPETDPRTFVPTSVIRTRDGRDYTTTYTYGGTSLSQAHFNQPVSVTASGDFTRTTTYEFEAFDGAPYIADRVSTETTSNGSESDVSTFAYDDDTGFLTSKTVLGVLTTFTPDGFGNVGSVTDASNHTTTSEYTWGTPWRTTTPAYVITRVIHPNGSVTSETRQGQTVSYEYDGLGRVTKVTPRVGAPTITDYDPETPRTVVVSRGASSTTQTLDGFGRVVWH